MVPIISEACETVVRARPENWKRNCSGMPRNAQMSNARHSVRLNLARCVKRNGARTSDAKAKR